MRKYITFTLVLLVIAACKTKKTVAEQIVSEQPVTKNKAREIIQKHY